MSYLKPKSRRDADALVATLAEEAFAKHALVTSARDRWRLRAPDHGYYWIEVIWTCDGGVFVHGDISPVLFRGGAPVQSATETIGWLANSHLDYAQGKARQGMMDLAPDKTADDVALDQLIGWREDAASEGADKGTRQALSDSIDALSAGEGVMAAQQILAAAGFESEDIARLGRVTPPAFIYAWYGVRRLAELLGLLRPDTRSANEP
jgi:hypothetical protein